SRIKKIVAQDEDIAICSNNAAFVLTLAAELFIQHLAEESHTQAKVDPKPRRNIQYKDVANAVARQDNLEFLEDIVPKTVPYKQVKGGVPSGPQQPRTKSSGKGKGKTADGKHQTTLTPMTNGSASAVNGNSSSHRLLLSPSLSRRAPPGPELAGVGAVAASEEDPSSQLELEMRQAQRSSSHDRDVDMTD
ncbi:DNA polymerase epsilon subunit 4, partial [Geosmithia morbida]